MNVATLCIVPDNHKFNEQSRVFLWMKRGSIQGVEETRNTVVMYINDNVHARNIEGDMILKFMWEKCDRLCPAPSCVQFHWDPCCAWQVLNYNCLSGTVVVHKEQDMMLWICVMYRVCCPNHKATLKTFFVLVQCAVYGCHCVLTQCAMQHAHWLKPSASAVYALRNSKPNQSYTL